MSEVRACGKGRMWRVVRSCLGRLLVGLLVILLVVGIEGARLIWRRVDRKPMLLGRGLDVVWRTPRHDGRVCVFRRSWSLAQRKDHEGATSDGISRRQ